MGKMETIGQKVPAIAESEIANKAGRLRNILGIFGPASAVKTIEFGVQRIFPEFDFEIVVDDVLLPDLALTWPDNFLMHVSEEVYKKAYEGNGFCNYALAHELGHLILHRNISPAFALQGETPKYDCFFNSEWQADKFADYFLMPPEDVIATCSTIEEIMEKYRVDEHRAAVHYAAIMAKRDTKSDVTKVKGSKKRKIKDQRQLAFEFLTKG